MFFGLFGRTAQKSAIDLNNLDFTVPFKDARKYAPEIKGAFPRYVLAYERSGYEFTVVDSFAYVNERYLYYQHNYSM